jgi:hypothetical protein
MTEVKAEFPIGKTQWAKWGPEAREAFNKSGRLGFKLATAVAEANAVQAKMTTQEPEEQVAPVETEKTEKTEKTETVQPVKKPAPKRKAK